IVRGQIADPHLAAKARDGRPEDIRGCLSCNQMCWGRRSRDYWISCLVNPSVGREWEWGGDRFAPAPEPKTVLVVGGGVAGLEAARVAAERGHTVTLAEASGRLGGQFRLAGLQPRRAQILDLIDWYGRQLEKLQVRALYDTLMEADEVRAFGADAVVIATGSLPAGDGFQKALPHLANLPGIERGRVWSAEDVMGRAARLGDSAIVYDEGGNWRGCGTAWKLAEDGIAVTLVTPDPMVGKELQRTAADFPLRQRLAQLGVRFICEAGILEWTGEGARIRSFLDGKEDVVAASDLVMATPNRAEDTLFRDLDGECALHLVGDAAAPRTAPYAIHDGRRVGLAI
ncbi:MAG: FAD-dependent oxidoreductase, partial [Rhodobiaceae bacterium]|nr:FAD-dependent oxidoreductase [Rhodobiaceae bacterium]